DRFGNRTTDLLSYQVKEGDNVLAAGSFKGNGETKLTFADAGVHLLTLVVAHPYAFLSRPLQLDIQQRGPGLVGQQWTAGTETYRPQLEFVFNESVALKNAADMSSLLRIQDNNGHILTAESFSIDDRTLVVALTDNTYPENSYRLLKEDLQVVSATTGAEFSAEVPGAYLTLNLPRIYLAADAGYQVEGETLSLEAITAQTSCSSDNQFTGARIQVAETGQSVNAAFACSGGQYRWTLPWQVTTFVEGEQRTLQMSTNVFAGLENPVIGNTLAITLLTVNGDFDLDGLPNLFEHTHGFNPLLADTDGNGINDGDEDADYDGLNNALELAFGTLWNNADTDGDGLNDAIEYQIGTIAVGAAGRDSDNDGISDYVEYTSLSDPTNGDDRQIDPFYIDQLELGDESRSFTLNGEDVQYQPTVRVHFHSGSYTEWINVTGMTELYTLSSHDLSIAQVMPGSVTARITAAGDTKLSVWLTELPVIRDEVLLHVEQAADTGLPD